MSNRIAIEGRSGQFGAYIARPSHLPAPADVVLQEVFGVNTDIERPAMNWPSKLILRWRRIFFGGRSPMWTCASILRPTGSMGFKFIKPTIEMPAPKRSRTPLSRSRSYLSAPERLPSRYCLGGLMTFLAAVRYGVDAALFYHGGDTEKYLDAAERLQAALLMHLAEEDESISKPAQSQIKTALAKVQDTEIYSYPGQPHAFSRHNRADFNAAAAALARSRSIEFLKRTLR
jgi:carboxymethylenebutenolidase